jgi:hypothetical protein
MASGKITRNDFVAFRDLDDDRAEVLGLHRFLNDLCDR